ncbi:MAG: cytochrome c [Gemmatimonadota bacterium]|nr:cytochrome c [Gemmatimonadota bacterium]MDH4351611.1 cytochrome c [Gemmatimonadota bacterium]
MQACTYLIVFLSIPLAGAAGQEPDSLPPGVTSQMLRNGQLLYEGPGLCTSCHGKGGNGIPNAGSDLTDTTWVHSDGSFEGILAQIQVGVPAEHSSTGTRMPERGASRVTPNQLKAIAAYVWSLSRGAQ